MSAAPPSPRPLAVLLRTLLLLTGALWLSGAACSGGGGGAPAPAPPAARKAPARFGYEVVESWPHDPEAFTQGLVYRDGRLFESTGLVGHSGVREVELTTGRVLRQRPLPAPYFGEGIALLNGRLHQLTWQSQRGFVYAADSFVSLGEWTYAGEGWGLTDDGTHLVMSDGTATLRFLDPASHGVLRTVEVRDGGQPVGALNELEWVKGEVWANVWQTQRLARIDPATGAVTGWVDLTGLLPPEVRTGREDVLNGIAYDAAGDRLLVTGKRWPRLFHIRLVPR